MSASDLKELETQSLEQTKQYQYLELISVPPSFLKKQQQSTQQETNPHFQSTPGFYSRVISAKQNSFKMRTDQKSDQLQSIQKSSTLSNLDPTTSTSLQNLLIQKEQQIDTLQRKYVKAKHINSRNQNKQGLNFMTGYSDRTIEQLRAILAWPNLNQDQKIYLQTQINEMIDFVNSLNEIFRQQQHHLTICTQRLTQADHIIKLLEKCTSEQVKENDLFNLRRMMTQLFESFASIQNSELDANCLYRDMQKLKLEFNRLLTSYEKVSQKCEFSEKNMHNFSTKFKQQNEENLAFKKKLIKEAAFNQIQQKRVNTLEQRLEILRGSDNYKKDKDSLRNIIEEMIRENELNKRKAFSKNQEVNKLEQQLAEFKEKYQKLSRRAYFLEKQLRQFGYSSYDLNRNAQMQIPLEEDSPEESDGEEKQLPQWDEVFAKGEPQRKLDFKLISLKSEHRNILLDLEQNGTQQTFDQLNRMKDQTEKLSKRRKKQLIVDGFLMILDSYVQFKRLGEKINGFSRITNDILEATTIEDVMIDFSNTFPQLLECENANIWLIDQLTATFYSLNSRKERTNALIDSDQFFEVVKSQKPLFINDKNSDKIVMFRCADTSEARRVKSCLLVPILSEGRMIGIISAANFAPLQYKIQNAIYITVISSFTMTRILQKISHTTLLKNQLKYKNILFAFMKELCNQVDHFSFQQCAQKYAETLFGIQSSLFYFYQQHNLVTYKSAKEFDHHPSNIGVAGLVAKTQQNVISSDISQHQAYHQRVDLKSPMPVFVMAILSKKEKEKDQKAEEQKEKEHEIETVAVLEIILNQRARLQANDKLLEVHQFLSPSETIQQMAVMFSEVVEFSYEYMSALIKYQQ